MGQGLTKREQEIVEWLREGKTSDAIGRILGISRRTVEKHCEHIYEKLGVTGRIGVFWHLLERGGGGIAPRLIMLTPLGLAGLVLSG